MPTGRPSWDARSLGSRHRKHVPADVTAPWRAPGPVELVPWWVTATDVNADGRPDFLVANGGGGSLAVLLGCGDGTFHPASTY